MTSQQQERPTLIDRLLGRPLSTEEGEENKIGIWEAIPYLGLDALASAGYGPEAALTLLIPLGLVGLTYAMPIMLTVLAILFILFLSYWQTIGAYPGGGGSYTVAKENLGRIPSLFAAAALVLDYMLDVAVGISAGVGALISAAPSLHSHTLSLTLWILVLITIVNLRGVRSSGLAFAFPTYLFIVTMLATIGVGLFKMATVGHHLTPAFPVPLQQRGHLPASPWVLGWLLMRSFASGCTAMTGVEAISNGVPNFKAPAEKRARQTLTLIVVLLGVILLGIMVLCRAFHIGATEPDSPQYQSVISQLVSAIFGRNWLYYLTIGSTLAVLALSANTGFADFPRLCRLLALDDFMPRAFATRGRRLVFTTGIIMLSLMTAGLLIAFGGITDRLIPLFAVGAFLAFTLSQFGMVNHWRKNPAGHSSVAFAINLIGGICTSLALIVIVVAKFAEGAWLTVIMLPALVILFGRIHRHYRDVERAIARDEPLDLSDLQPPLVVVPVRDWTMVSCSGLSFAMRISPEVVCVHVMDDEEVACKLETEWHRLVSEPAAAAKVTGPKLVVLPSPYRKIQMPLLGFIKELLNEHPGRLISVIIPELQEMQWYQYPLHNQRATALKATLLFFGDRRVSVVNVPWYLK